MASERAWQVLAAIRYSEYVDAWSDIPYDLRPRFRACWVWRVLTDGSTESLWFMSLMLPSVGPCPKCGEVRGLGPDPCLGLLPGVAHACCGHGNPRDAYVVVGGEPNQGCAAIPHYVTVRGQDALDLFAILKRGEEVWNVQVPDV